MNRFHITSVQDLRRELTACIMRNWGHPTIAPTRVNPRNPHFNEYEHDENTSEFIVSDSFTGDYVVTIRKVS